MSKVNTTVDWRKNSVGKFRGKTLEVEIMQELVENTAKPDDDHFKY